MYEGELPALRPLFWMPGGKKDWAKRWNFWNSALDRHGITRDQLPEKVSSMPEAMTAAYQHYASMKSASIWGCKSPNYYDSLKDLARDFPRARFIIIWRDPADICRSILRAAASDSWFRKKGIPHRALFGLRQMKLQRDFLLQHGFRVHEIAYEDLVQRPEVVMESICRFLEIPFDARMTTLEGADRSAIYSGEHHAGVKSTKIQVKKSRPEVLPAALKGKIQRYTSLWLKESDGNWPPVSGDVNLIAETPGILEQASDWMRFRWMRLQDRAVACIYCFAPILMLAKYRQAKAERGGPEAAAGGKLVQ